MHINHISKLRVAMLKIDFFKSVHYTLTREKKEPILTRCPDLKSSSNHLLMWFIVDFSKFRTFHAKPTAALSETEFQIPVQLSFMLV